MEISLRQSATVFLIALLMGCGALPEKEHTYRVSNIHIENIGYDDDQEAFCKAFKPDVTQVQGFFDQAQIVGVKTYHDDYDYLPCFATGKLTFMDKTEKSCDFSVRAGGTAELICEDGSSFLFGCSDCGTLSTP